jgi:hypothetical protein
VILFKKLSLNKIYFISFLFLCLNLNSKDVIFVKPPEDVVNEFRYLGNALVCIMDSLYLDNLPCLHFGEVKIGSTLEEVESIYNDIYKAIPESDSIETRVYILESECDTLPYMVIEYKSNLVNSLQLTGRQTNADLDFSSIKLGDSEEYARKILGEPGYIKEVSGIGGYLWSYTPFPISIEIVNKKVYSIKIWKPEKGKE